MSTIEEFDELLNQHRSIQRSMPRTWNAFFGSFGSLRPVQLLAIPPVLAGCNVLVTAPTAGGKTQAVIAPLCEQLTRDRWPGLSLLVITPTRALVNDLFQRLSHPLDQLRIRLGRKTSDYGLDEQTNVQALITTPESTESLLTFRRELLNSVRAIVMDEIHLLDGSPRGDQLRMLLRRLLAYRRFIDGQEFKSIQRVAMSATVSEPERLAVVYLGEDAQVVTVPGQRAINSRIILASGDDKERAEYAIEAASEFADVRKILVFVNSRKQVDAGANYFQFGRFSAVPIYGHHGSLSKSERENAETRFKFESQAICVATMTLEIGIDIGDIDLVICMDPPFSLSSFLQRIGRGCRRLNGLTRVLCVARNRAGELIFNALINQAALGVPVGPTPPFRRSVLVQQTLAYLRQVPKNHRVMQQFVNVFSSGSDPAIDQEAIRGVLDGMVEHQLLDVNPSGIYQPASKGWNFINGHRIFSNIQSTPLEVTLIDVETGRAIVDVASVDNQAKGIRIAGRSYEVLPGGSRTQHRVRQGGDHEATPRYYARALPYAFDIGASLFHYLGVESDTLLVISNEDRVVVMTWLGSLCNQILAAGINHHGHRASGGAFHLIIHRIELDSILPLLREVVNDVMNSNALSNLRIERFIDIGPHFRLLSEAQQKCARDDWLNADYLNNWVANLSRLTLVNQKTELGLDLIALT